jgi:FdhE protein
MNLKLIDFAINSYAKTLDAGDQARLAFFRTLWEVQNEAEKMVGSTYTLADEAELMALLHKGEPFFMEHPVSIDKQLLADTLGKLAALTAESGLFSEVLQNKFASAMWDRIVAASKAEEAGKCPHEWLAYLYDVLIDDGMADEEAQVASLLASMALKPQLVGPAAGLMSTTSKLADADVHPLMCPVCGCAPHMAHVGGETSSQGRGRLLMCPQCAAAWEFERVRCARCGTKNQESLHFFNIEGDETHRLATCDECGGYIRTLYSEDELMPCCYEVEDVVMTRLDAIAQDPSLAGSQGE